MKTEEDTKINTNIENIESDDSETNSNKIQYYTTEKYSEINNKNSEVDTSDEESINYKYKHRLSEESYITTNREIDPTMPIINDDDIKEKGAKSLTVRNDSTFYDKYSLLDLQNISLEKSLNQRDDNQEGLIDKYPMIDDHKYIQNDNREINIHESNKSNDLEEKSILYPNLDSYDIFLDNKSPQDNNIIRKEEIGNESIIKKTNYISVTNNDLISVHESVIKDSNALRMPDSFPITKGINHTSVTNNDYNSLGAVKQENNNLLTDQKNENKKHENSNIESIIKDSNELRIPSSFTTNEANSKDLDLLNIKQNNIVSSDNNDKNRSGLKASDNNYNGTIIGFSILFIAVVIGIVYSRSKNTHDMDSKKSIDQYSDDDLVLYTI